MEKVCICIPARLHSTRLDQKLLYKLGDMTCIERTVSQCLKSKLCTKIYVLTDSTGVINALAGFEESVEFVLTDIECKNGTERISRYLGSVLPQYKYVVNVQADEPFIDPENIDFAIQKHMEMADETVYYTTLHHECNEYDYIKSPSCVKVVVGINDNVLLYSRGVIPSNKRHMVNTNMTYKIFTGIYVFNRHLLEKYHVLKDTPLQLEEDVEQLKILEHGYKIKSYPTVRYNEISLNTKEDYVYLVNKYFGTGSDNNNNKIKFVVFDLDGVFTDGKIYVSSTDTFKCYNGKDSYALKLLNNKNILTGLITAHDTNLLKKMEHIYPRMNYVSAGNYDKLTVLDNWLAELKLSYEQVAYIGDDIPDIAIIEKVGFSACPADAVEEVKKVVKYVCKNKSGDGAVREFVSIILEAN